jgi:hypothetical protein
VKLASTAGCFDPLFPGACSIERYLADRVFSMRPAGSGLRQLTMARGVEIDPDGRMHVELPGPVSIE